MKYWKCGFFCIFFCLAQSVWSQYIQVDDTYSAQQLVQDVLIDSPCANVSNFSVTGDAFSSGSNSYGYFTNPSSPFPFANGVVLSTARATRSAGPNDNLVDEGSTAWGGDNDLEQALGIGGTVNATVLEFDFTPLTSQISFDYIFASEEYSGSAPCQYSDGFAFLLKPAGSSAPYQNLAVLPNSSTPVLVTSVHPQIGSSCPAINEQYFGGFNQQNSPINFNGQTVVLTAKGNVVPGTLYHIKLVIADEQNIRYDSAIFLGGGSFQVGTDIGPDRLVATNNPVCEGETYVLDATEPGNNTYQWFKNNTAIPGATASTYSVVDSGTYSVNVNLGGNGCIASGEAVIEFTPKPVLNDPTVLVQCDDNNDGITTYNLTKADNIVKMGNTSLGNVVYYKTLTDAQNEVNQIPNPTTYQNTASNQVVARVENSFGCPAFATVNLQIANNSLPNSPTYYACDADTDGLSSFTLSDVDNDVTTGLPSGIVVQYYLTMADAISGTNAISINTFQNTTPFQQIVYATLTNGPDCYGIIRITLIVRPFVPAGFDPETIYICSGNAITIGVANGFSSYQWTSGQTGVNQISVTSPGTYSVTVSNVNGCFATKQFTVLESGIATVDSVTVNDFTGDNNTVLVHYSGIGGNYEFSLDGQLYQSSPVFTNVAPGQYLLYIRDNNGCGISPPYPVTVMDYPRFFTPNADGFNDVWEIKNLNSQPNASVNIFDRYGKLVYSFKGNGAGWNGRLNNIDLPSDDYWFTISLENGRTVKSHFSLKR
ncbi:MAG: T9SS type B sorting domain-containing protein [Flavobacterium sp.]|nr:MAG: T9SS type B sorting domain-containing protein [Flavobacterium sp.]